MGERFWCVDLRERSNLESQSFRCNCAFFPTKYLVIFGISNSRSMGVSASQEYKGGIRGNVKGPFKSIVHVFSSPVWVNSVEAAEIESILYILSLGSLKLFKGKRIVIFSDLINALDQVRTRLRNYFPSDSYNRNLSALLDSRFFLQYVPRDFNEDAYQLAKEGLNRPTMHSYWAGVSSCAVPRVSLPLWKLMTVPFFLFYDYFW